MAGTRNSNVIAATVLIAIAGLAFVANAVNEDVAASRVPYPDIPKGQGDNCVEDTEFMRRYHMTLLLHQRDDTMLKGIRSKQYSLKECISCHAVPGPDSIPVTFASPEHFCRSCHDYAAVSIDCFECHASRPEQEIALEDGEQ
jgi:[DsrC]-trisulfide reductase subunit J